MLAELHQTLCVFSRQFLHGIKLKNNTPIKPRAALGYVTYMSSVKMHWEKAV